MVKDQGPYSPTILKNSLCLFLQDFVNLNVTQWFSQPEVVYIQMLLNIEKSGKQDLEHFEELWANTDLDFIILALHFGTKSQGIVMTLVSSVLALVLALL